MSRVLRTASCTLITRPRFELAPGSLGPSSVGPPHRGEEQRGFQLRNEERRGPSHPEQPGGALGRREPALCGQKTRGCRVCSPPCTCLCEGLLEASRSVQAAPRVLACSRKRCVGGSPTALSVWGQPGRGPSALTAFSVPGPVPPRRFRCGQCGRLGCSLDTKSVKSLQNSNARPDSRVIVLTGLYGLR